MSRKRRKPALKRPNQAVANVAPITADSGPLHTSAEALRYIRQNKHNPLPYLKPEMLSRVLESFEHGRIREAVLLWEKMAERDDMISSVKPKREKDVSQLDMQVVVEPDSGQAGLEHRAVLNRFWKTCRAVNSYDRNERGGFRRLIKQMMTATSFRYAAHHIIWDPRPNGELRATFEFVPLWLFENTTGKLRYLKSMSAITGEDLDDSEWMVTVGDGLMIACSIGYLAKRSAFNDWLIFSEKFSVPGVLGRTSAKAGTPEALAMESAVMAFGHDWCSLITGDDGTHAKPIEIIQAAGNPAGMPMPAVIERIDRRMAALYRGADLSSMSSGQHSKGAGASLQQKETEILLRDDAETLAETLAEVSRLVIEWHFGNGVEPLARVELVVPIQEDSNEIVTSATQLADRGAKVSSSALMERLNLPAAKDGEDALQPMAKGPAPAMPADLVPGGLESLHNSALDTGMKDLRKALAADLQPLGDALYGAYQQHDFSAMRAALRKISADMPALAGDAENLSGLLAEEMAAAYLGDGSEDVENGDSPGHPFRGNQHGGKSATTSQRVDSIPEVIHASMIPGNQKFCDWGDIGNDDVELLKSQFGLDLSGAKRVMASDEVRKILRDHGNDPLPVTYQDLENLPKAMGGRTRILASERPGKLPRLISLIPNGDTTVVVEEVRTGRNKLALVSMRKVGGTDQEKITRTLRAIPEGSVAQTAGTDAGRSSKRKLS